MAAAAEKGSLEPLADAVGKEAAAGPGLVPSKRMRVDAGAKKSAVGGSNTSGEEATQQTPGAAVGEGSSTSPAAAAGGLTSRPRPLRFPPYPRGGSKLELLKWQALSNAVKLCRIFLGSAQHWRSANAVLNPTDKMDKRNYSVLVLASSWVRGSPMEATQFSSDLFKIHLQLHVGLPNKTILDGKFLFFNDHYGITLLEIDVDFPLESPTLGSCPKYGQKVFVLARDSEFSLRARHGKILWLEESDCIGSNYQMFLSCEFPKGSSGAPVIDHDGNVTGMAFYSNPNPSVLSISTIIRCIDMWMTFGHIARPIHGLGLRTFELLDVSFQEEIYLDHGINSGFIVDMVSDNSAAESVGILPGDMIVSLDEQHAMTLPQLEDHFLKLGWIFLNNPNSTVDLKLEVYDLMNRSKTSITLPLQFCDT